jgi:flagellar hook-associated protein 2
LSSSTTVSGISSGIDWKQTVEALMSIEQNKVTLIENRQTSQQRKLDAWRGLDTRLLAMQNSMETLEELDNFASYTVNSSDTDVVSSIASSSAVPGVYGIEVNRLASNSRVIHEGWVDDSTTAINTSGSDQVFAFDFGTGDDLETFSITLSDGSTLSDLKSLINSHADNDGVRASIINDGSGGATAYHLVLSSTDTGASTVISINDALTTVGSGSEFDNAAFPDQTIGENAELRVNGYPASTWIESESNSVTDVLEGVTLNLHDTNVGGEVTVTVNQDLADVKTKIQNFVDSYNDVIGTINLYTSYDAENEAMGLLFGDSSANQLERRLNTLITHPVSGLPDSARYDNLSEIGIKSGEGGLLSIDSDTLSEVLEDNFSDVATLFTFGTRNTDSNLTFFTRTIDTAAGEHAVSVDYAADGSINSATIGGEAATVDGNFIVGLEGTDAEGLRILFTDPEDGGGILNSTISLQMGIASLFRQTLDSITDSDSGLVHFQTDRIEDSIESLTTQVADMESRLVSVRQNYERQFLTMENTLTRLQTQGNYISSQLS